jgi:hypothetical protein
MKKSTNTEPRECDLAKLRCFRRQLRYQYGVFIELRAGSPTTEVLRMEWQGAPRSTCVRSEAPPRQGPTPGPA